MCKNVVQFFDELREDEKENLRALCDSINYNPDPVKEYKKSIFIDKKFDLKDMISLTQCFNLAIDLINKDVEMLK